MNTFKTLSLYNRHAVDCKHIKGETQTGSGRGLSQGRTVQNLGGLGSSVVKRSFGTGQSGYSPQNKRINAKIEFKAYKVNGNSNSNSNDDEITIIDNKPSVKHEAKPPMSVTVGEVKKQPFTVMNSYNTHFMNQGPRLFRCFECDAAFDTKSNLEVHVREGHKDKFCEECEDDFSWPDESHDCYYTRYQLRYISGDIVPTF